MPMFGGVKYYCILDAYYKTDSAGEYKDAWDCFKATGVTKSVWDEEIYTPNS